MSKKASPTLIGIFTLVGLILAAGGLVLVGAGKFFEKSSNMILYFDKSANGLLVGSEVRFGGVRIGRVTSIKVIIDQKGDQKIIPVVVQLSAKDLRDVSSTSVNGIDLATESGVKAAVADGLRARMKQQSLLTGQLYIEFDIVPEVAGFIYHPEQPPPYPTVPTIGAEMDELIAGVADGLKKFNALNLEIVMQELRDVLSSAKKQIQAIQVNAINENLIGITSDIKKITGNDKLGKVVDSLDETLANLNVVSQKAKDGIDPMVSDFESFLKQADAGLIKIDKVTADVSELANPRAPVLIRVQNSLEEVERASRAIRELANDLKRNPNSILAGREDKP